MILIHKSLPILVCHIFLPFVSSSSQETPETTSIHQMSPEVSSEIVVHGFLFWASMGLLMPVGILIMRMRMVKRQDNATRVKLIFYLHATLQILSVLLATIGAILSIRNFQNSFNNIHQRMGLFLYFAIWLQALTGILRPKWGRQRRNIWYMVHWVLGSAVSLLGIINIYTGLQAYHKKTSRSSRIWTILFTVEISIIASLYLLQEKWEYIKKQGMSLGNEPVQPTDQDSSLGDHNQKETPTQP